MRPCHLLGECVVPDISAGPHSERDEEPRLHVPLEWLVQQMGYNGLQVIVPFARIKKSFPRRKMDCQGFLLRPPVLKTGGMRKHMARGNELEARIPFEKTLRGVLGQRRVEIHHA